MRLFKRAAVANLFLLLSVCTSLYSQKKEDRGYFWYESIQRSTVSLGIKAVLLDSTKVKVRKFDYYKTFGTGAIFYVKRHGEVLQCIVTAKHVLKDIYGKYYDSIRFRTSNYDEISVFDNLGYNLSLNSNGKKTWFELPDSSIDLACIPLEVKGPINRLDTILTISYSFFPTELDYYEGEEIIAFGYPAAVGSNYWTRSILRKGIVAWLPKYDIEKKKFLIDCDIFPGNSGGPVFNNPERSLLFLDDNPDKYIKFLGIVTERRFNKNKIKTTNPSDDSLYSLESIGIGVVEPAKNVLNLLRLTEKALNESNSSAKK
jgi:hypothetical protein